MAPVDIYYHAANYEQRKIEHLSAAAGELRRIEDNLRGAGALSAEAGRAFQLLRKELDGAVDEAQAAYYRFGARCDLETAVALAPPRLPAPQCPTPAS